jgi:chorismate mutase
MIANDILNEDVSDFATRLEAMTSDEVFAAMNSLEKHSEDDASDREEILSGITLVEEEIERRFPGQMLAPYRDWKREQPLMS